jgi:hypothetical protein
MFHRAMASTLRVRGPTRSPNGGAQKNNDEEEASINDVSVNLVATPTKTIARRTEEESNRSSRSLPSITLKSPSRRELGLPSLNAKDLESIVNDLKGTVSELCPPPSVGGASAQAKGPRELRSRREHDALDTFLLAVFEYSMDVRFAVRVMRLVSSKWNQSILRLLHSSQGSSSSVAGNLELPPMLQSIRCWAVALDQRVRQLLAASTNLTVRCGEVYVVLDLLRASQLLGTRLAALSNAGTTPLRLAQQLWKKFLENPMLFYAHAATSCGMYEAAFREYLPTPATNRSVAPSKRHVNHQLKSGKPVYAAGRKPTACSDVIRSIFQDAYVGVKFSVDAAALVQQAREWKATREKKNATPSPMRMGS